MGATVAETRMDRLERAQVLYETQLSNLHLQLEDQEDRNRCNNLRIRGLPETEGPENLMDIVTSLFRTVLEQTDPEIPAVQLDRVYRALGPRHFNPPRSRDIICCVHHYPVKDSIAQKAWEHGPFMFLGTEITIMPDLSRGILQRRDILRSLLDILRTQECTYRWGHHFHL